jgi:hypothetical protein
LKDLLLPEAFCEDAYLFNEDNICLKRKSSLEKLELH